MLLYYIRIKTYETPEEMEMTLIWWPSLMTDEEEDKVVTISALTCLAGGRLEEGVRGTWHWRSHINSSHLILSSL